jgi:hypothetical protein
MSENKTPSGSQGIRSTAQNPVTAIDIVLEPHKTMIQHAQDANTDRAPVRGGHLV